MKPFPSPEWERFGSATLAEDGCAVCGDVAVPVQVLEVRGNEAVVEDRKGQRAEVAVDFVPDVRVGEILLVHLGVAIGRALEVHVEP
ncbi:HypC/HybG/HupF family hydrogenase formation chaperone [Kyrpidia tusciae]|uniref:Hydrogenase maturation factor n=1 Tax=Kyrpidia tusciae (strain DSM 2912 / NBRC 15312 / T2) TaxID=562970 RepID=D5WTE0_KYRT2|nr:HypC/HybG/HupF family hydrogenase formation chaperone [Kyrpidia tusciae]ADG07176.1 hydrogenase maturation factor [Kyrpidia tusciae DSM 2912]MBE3551843.1 HypC/HybG/HupF family hydrogenase formation chaperone [Kyrpidia tusciae]